MTDILIRDVPEDVVAAIDRAAKRLGLSRTAYLRREVTSAARRTDQPVTRASFVAFTETYGDLDDPAVMKQAWE